MKVRFSVVSPLCTEWKGGPGLNTGHALHGSSCAPTWHCARMCFWVSDFTPSCPRCQEPEGDSLSVPRTPAQGQTRHRAPKI